MKDTENKKECQELKALESNIEDFIRRTPDFNEYACEINKWLDTHDEMDIAVAYQTVKNEKEVQGQPETETVKELNYFKKFFSDIEPLLDKLEKNPQLVKAIMDGSIK